MPDSRPKWSVYTQFPTKTAQKPYSIGGGGGGGGVHTAMGYITERSTPPGLKTGPLVLEFNFKDALYIFKKIANGVAYISSFRIRTHVWATKSRSFYIERRFALTNRRASVWKLWLQIFLRFPIVFIDDSAQSILWLIYWHLEKTAL